MSEPRPDDMSKVFLDQCFDECFGTTYSHLSWDRLALPEPPVPLWQRIVALWRRLRIALAYRIAPELGDDDG